MTPLVAVTVELGRVNCAAIIGRCPHYPRKRRYSGHQPSELSARPPALAVRLSVALLDGLSLGGLLLFELALALLRLGDLPPVVLQYATVALLDVGALCRLADDKRVRPDRGNHLEGHVWTAPAVQEESDYQRSVRVRSCIRPLNAAVWPLALM